MAPLKKAKTVNKKFALINKFSSIKDEGFSNKYKKKKRKLPDLLGPQWSKQELEQFYDAFRKCGEDWKKVASIVRNRSTEMVEALYNMNRAYLSLPEGIASVAGLIAMMTDHYNCVDENIDNIGSNESYGRQKKLRKCVKGTSQPALRKDYVSPSLREASTNGALLLKGHFDGIHPFIPVRKRTPRVPVSILESKDYTIDSASPTNKSIKLDSGTNDEIMHGLVEMPSEPRLKVGYAGVSLAMYREAEMRKLSQDSFDEKMGKQFETKTDEESFERSGEVKISTWMDTSKYMLVGKKGNMGGKGNVIGYDVNNYSEFNGSGRNAESQLYFSHSEENKEGRLHLEDDGVDFDALQTLADLSVTMTESTERHVESPRKSADDRADIMHSSRVSDVKVTDKDAKGERKKKGTSQPSKVRMSEQGDSQPSKVAEKEVLLDGEINLVESCGQVDKTPTVFKQCNSEKSSDSLYANDQADNAEVTVPERQESSSAQVAPNRRHRKRKMDKVSIRHDSTCLLSVSGDRLCNCSPLLQKGAHRLELENLLPCLACQLLRRWCTFEWFYSAIDYPWFAKREFVEYLNHVGLGHIPRLTRVEWGVIRSSLGKPRRFSEHFLREEREKLNQYRHFVRVHNSELRAGLRDGVPTDLARPLSVGQRVIAIHPKTRDLHDGSILTVNHDKFRVQFDRQELGVEFVVDIDCMPLIPMENMPESLRRHRNSFDPIKDLKVDGYLKPPPVQHINALQLTTDLTKAKETCINNDIGNGTLKSLSAAQHYNMGMVNIKPERADLQAKPEFAAASSRQALAESGGVKRSVYYTSHFSRSEEQGSRVAAVVTGSRETARRMVDNAIQAMGVGGADSYARISEAVGARNSLKFMPTIEVPEIPETPPLDRGQITTQNRFACNSESLQRKDDFETKLNDGPERKDFRVPAELITSCITTVLVIQRCSERQYPPAEVAQIIDTAVTNLYPAFSQSLPIYREIEMCMGRIKNQLLALVPT